VSNLSDHIAFVRLVDLAEGRFPPDDLAAARSHLAACQRCAAEVAWLERVIELMRTDTAEQPPAHAVAAAKRMFRPPAVPVRPQRMAMLQFDSANAPAAIGRRAGAPAERQLLFAAEDYLLDLRLVPQGSLWAISGQLLGTTDVQKIDLNGPAGMEQAELNDLNEFALPPLPPGTYTLRLQLIDFDIVVAGFEVG
jgi:hypothetical protein